MRKLISSPYLLIGLVWLMAVLNFFGLYLGWYWQDWHYDKISHLLGGFFVGSVFFYFFQKKPTALDLKKNWLITFTLVLGFAALIGVGWEFLEFTLDQILGIGQKVTPLIAQGNVADTIGDLLFDLLGSGFFAIVYWKLVLSQLGVKNGSRNQSAHEGDCP